MSLLELLGDLGGDSVHVGGTLLGEGLTVGDGGSVLLLVGDGSNETSLLQFGEAVSDALSSCDSGSLSAGSVSLFSSVVLSEGVHSDPTSHVELVGNGRSPHVEPVWIVWGEVLETGGFIVSGPLFNIIFN